MGDSLAKAAMMQESGSKIAILEVGHLVEATGLKFLSWRHWRLVRPEDNRNHERGGGQTLVAKHRHGGTGVAVVASVIGHAVTRMCNGWNNDAPGSCDSSPNVLKAT